ncbi:hypothetical protein FRC11_009293 [Ceratobasidium sp. 423]|nr:hypothetical protein FRC11_009293 [Ceratobasidium sp. 423]
MTIINAVLQTPFKSQRRLDTAIFNVTRFTPGTIPPILPYLNICNMVPESRTSVYDPHTKKHNIGDDWVFQHLIFYAHAEQEFHPDYANKPMCKRNRWTLHVIERSLSTKKSRTVLLEPTFNPQGQLCGFTMCLEAESAPSPMTWAVQHFKIDAIPYSPPNGRHPREFYHCEWMVLLNDRVCQGDYMRVLPADRTGFFINMAVVLGQIYAIDRSVIDALIHTVGEVWSSSNSVLYPPELPATVSPSMLLKKH